MYIGDGYIGELFGTAPYSSRLEILFVYSRINPIDQNYESSLENLSGMSLLTPLMLESKIYD